MISFDFHKSHITGTCGNGPTLLVDSTSYVLFTSKLIGKTSEGLGGIASVVCNHGYISTWAHPASDGFLDTAQQLSAVSSPVPSVTGYNSVT